MFVLYGEESYYKNPTLEFFLHHIFLQFVTKTTNVNTDIRQVAISKELIVNSWKLT